MRKSLLARNLEIPRKPVFVLEGMEVVQRTDTAAFVSNSVTDSIMYGTNGNVGLRSQSEMETVRAKTIVLLAGAYHELQRDSTFKCAVLSRMREVGGPVCGVELDCLIDGETGTLVSIPARRLSLNDGAYRGFCEDVISADGGLLFNCTHTRAVSCTDLSLWGTECCYTDFRIMPPTSPVTDDAMGTMMTHVRWGSSARLGSFAYAGTDGGGGAAGHINGATPHPAGGPSTSSYKVEFVVSFLVDLDHWELLKAEQMDEVVQRSHSSKCVVRSATETQFVVVGADGSQTVMTPVVEMHTMVEGGEQGGMGLDRFGYLSQRSSSYKGRDGSYGGLGSNSGGPPTPGMKECGRRFVIRLTCELLMNEANLPRSVTVTFKARHYVGSMQPPVPFPPLTQIIEERRQSLEEFWRTFEIDMQLQEEELNPNRMRLALLYNAFRLFGVSYNLENGLTRSGCSSGMEGMQFDLTLYIHHGVFYCLTQPERGLALLKSLYKMLPTARTNAHLLSLSRGAIFPRRTVTGCNSHRYSSIHYARLHVNAEVGFLINLFFDVVDAINEEDRLLLLELALESARVWLEIGQWVEGRTAFRVDYVAGPDEYNSSAAGSFYINLCVKMQMENVAQIFVQQEKLLGSQRVHKLLQRINMTRDEIREMEQASNAMHIKRDERTGTYLVHENFDDLMEWTTERVKHPLSANYHPVAIFRRKLVDVPEVLLGMFMYSHLFERSEFEKNLAYYEPLCTYDSPEAIAVFAVSRCRARREFSQPIPLMRALSHLDLDNVTFSAEEGLHFGAMSTTMLTMFYGIGGIRIHERTLTVNPLLPAGVTGYNFTLCYRGAVMRVSVDDEKVLYELISGDSLRFVHGVSRNRIHLHVGFNSCTAMRRVSIPRISFSQIGHFDGAIFLTECIFDNVLEFNYCSWSRTLEGLFENYRTLQHRSIPPLNPEEYIDRIAYQYEESEIAFSGIHKILLSRDINLELGTSDDAEIVETRYGLANARVAEMAEMLEHQYPGVNNDICTLVKRLAWSGVALAAVSYSRSMKRIVDHYPELASLFVARIEGDEAHERRIRGRPHLDLFLRAAEKIHVHPSRCLVFSHHLDRDYAATEMAKFCMFLDVDDPFVSSRAPPRPYPQLTPEEVKTLNHTNPVVCRLSLKNMPTSIEEIEDIVDGRSVPDPLQNKAQAA